MLTGLYIVASIIGAWLLSYHRARLWLWTLVIGAWLVFWDWLRQPGQPIELVLTTSRIRGEEGLPHRSRWTFSAGISF